MDEGPKNGRNTNGREFHKTEGVDPAEAHFWGEGGASSSDSHPRLPYYRGPEAVLNPKLRR